MFTARQLVELFHLLFCRALNASLPDKTLIAIKGGINLRLFFQSPRFSQDLDLDVVTMAKETLENRVDRLLESPLLINPLKARGVVIKDVTKPKQTATAQKWKLGIASTDSSIDERTKLEFSRRDDVRNAAFEKVDAELAKRHGVPAFLATHYRAADAVRQKVHALMDRSETQPRDVFDLNILFARPDAPETLDAEAASWLDLAISNVMGLSYDDYGSLVVAFLEPEHAELYGSRQSWDLMQMEVVGRLEALR